MGRLGWLGAALLLVTGSLTGCDTSGTTDTQIAMHFDAGPPDGGEVVILDGGGEAGSPPDGVSMCPQGICNYQTGAGCPAATPACIPFSSGTSGGAITPACSPAGAGKTGAACTMVTDCAAGYFCAEGQCHKLCCGGDWTGCDSPTEHCLKNLDYSDGNGGAVPTGAMLCYPVDTCDALAPTSCPQSGTVCLIADATGATACLPPGTGGTGAACPCQGGFACVNRPGMAPACHRLCKAIEGGAPPYCQDGEGDCIHYAHDPAGVGECTTP